MINRILFNLQLDNNNQQLNNMVTFIIQEGTERSDAIDARAEEDYNIIKGDEIQKGRLKINSMYALKEQQMVVTNRTTDSLSANLARIKTIQEKENILQDLVEEVRYQVRLDMRNTERYKSILMLLVIEGLYRLMEKTVYIKCREKDEKLVKSILPECKNIYETKTKLKLNVSIYQENYLPCDSLGGVILFIDNKKISVTNTLDMRVEQIGHFSTPIIFKCLFTTKAQKL